MVIIGTILNYEDRRSAESVPVQFLQSFSSVLRW